MREETAKEDFFYDLPEKLKEINYCTPDKVELKKTISEKLNIKGEIDVFET